MKFSPESDARRAVRLSFAGYLMSEPKEIVIFRNQKSKTLDSNS